MIIELIYPSLIITACIALSAGLLSCFVVWRRMAFYADALSHSAILGTSVALLVAVHPLYGLMLYGLIVALALSHFSQKLQLSSDTFLAIISQTSLALGLLALSALPQQYSIEALLFGDILAASKADIWPAAVLSLAILAITIYHRQALVRLCLDEELAKTEGVNTQVMNALLMLMLVALIALAIQLLGVLLVSTLLLMPAATARSFARSPGMMLALSPIIAILACALGLSISIYFDKLMTGPTIVVVAACLWLLSLCRQQS
ncbi:MAG: metal ABC transporter permease [Pseudomonadales bacterium]|nr:metal ABC transporter permease [Pseudomonadales bacterium]